MIATERNKAERFQIACQVPELVEAEMCRRSLFHFEQTFWDEVSQDKPVWNWHIPYLCSQLEEIARRVAEAKPKTHDLIINIPPGTTKSITCSIMFPAWSWVNWPWMKFICASYAEKLSLEHAQACRDLIRSDKFKRLFPHLEIRRDKDQKSNFKLVVYEFDELGNVLSTKQGGNRFSTSVGGTLTGFHGHVLIVDDPINPMEAVSATFLETANSWMDQTLSTRKVDKENTPTVLIMQRLHQEDPTGHILDKEKKNVKHICLPGQIRDYRKFLKPPEVEKHYEDDLLDVKRMPWPVMQEMEADLGQYGFAGQVGQNPTPPGGGMFKVVFLENGIIDVMPRPSEIVRIARYWDKAGTEAPTKRLQKKTARTCGVKMAKLRNGKFLVLDVKKGHWSTDLRESIIRAAAEADGPDVLVYHEQEPGSGGKDSAKATTLNLAGFSARADRPTGDKIYRADPYSVQVNAGNVLLYRGEWNKDFIEEHRFFPFGRCKDQVDSASGVFNKLTGRRRVRNLRGKR
jgi:predicted phage terminase large subunit-like protein